MNVSRGPTPLVEPCCDRSVAPKCTYNAGSWTKKWRHGGQLLEEGLKICPSATRRQWNQSSSKPQEDRASSCKGAEWG